MIKKLILSFVAIVALATTSLYAQEKQEQLYHRGVGKFVFTEYAPLKNKPITVYYYIPKKGDIKNMRVLFSMHGAERSGKSGIAIWRKFAERDGFIVLSPEYIGKYYREWEYQFGGVARRGKVQPREKWTYNSIEAIFDHFKKHTGSTAEVYDMYGHSAGGQFTHRFALAMPDARLNIGVASNPGNWTFPLAEGLKSKKTGKVYGWPYSVKGTPLAKDDVLKKYFSRKLYVQVGKLDTATIGKHVPKNDASLTQGKHRLDRGRNAYKTAKKVAKKNGWEFNWGKAEVKDMGHKGRGMAYGKVNDGKTRYREDNYSKTGAYYLIFQKDKKTK
ncbi:MAG: hypothetical protein E7148_00315 [Rikenellaceae bacterium]|nr:hypothetical protein [Rikenellaceae bacterium]